MHIITQDVITNPNGLIYVDSYRKWGDYYSKTSTIQYPDGTRNSYYGHDHVMSQ